VSADGTLRVWEQSTLLQLYEFSAAGEVATCLAYHPRPDRHLLACGFTRGHLRVFDVASTRTLVEYQARARTWGHRDASAQSLAPSAKANTLNRHSC
jgi:hypothetical protein